MKVCKSVIVFVGMLLLFISINVSAGSQEVQLSMNPDTGEFTVEGYANPKSKVSLVVVNPDKNIDDIYMNESVKVTDVINTSNQAATDRAGQFKFSYKMQGIKGQYTLRLRGDAFSIPFEKSFYFYPDSEVETALRQINAAVQKKSAADMMLAIQTHKEGLWLNKKIFENAIQDKQQIGNMLIKNAQYAKCSDFQAAFDIAVILQGLYEAKTQNDVLNILNLYESTLDLSRYGAYKTYTEVLSSERQGNTLRAIAGKKFENLDGLGYSFCEQAILQAIQGVTLWTDVNGILISNNDSLKLDFTKYNALRTSAAVDMKLAGKSFSNLQALVEAFKNAVEEQGASENDKADSKSGSTSGKSGSLTMPALPDVNQTSDVKSIAFDDLEDVAWAVDSITALAKRGIVSGKTANEFKPSDFIKREEFIKMLVLSFNMSDPSAECNYKDVENEWYKLYIASADKKNITKGIGDGYFGIGQSITRQEVASFLFRAAQASEIVFEKNDAQPFADDNDVEIYAKDAVYAMHNAKIINGTGEGKFSPSNLCTRAEAAKMIFEIMRYAKIIQ